MYVEEDEYYDREDSEFYDEVSRPILLTIIAVITILLGILYIGVALFEQLVYIILADLTEVLPGFLEGLVFGSSIVTLIWGVLMLIMGIGMIKGWHFSWYLIILLLVIQIVLNVISLNIIMLIIYALMLYYFFRYNTKEFFGV